ncbi:DciA family protein [Streptomyces sp. NPDC097704]|uniref:DciA family protein n=1 Tax=Streptomyces sp. NPDC097704 TaxID=3157101 RepID=UPI003326797F
MSLRVVARPGCLSSPGSPAYATQLRLMTPRIVEAANQRVGAAAVRTVRVRRPGTRPTTPAPAPTAGTAPEPAGPVKTCETDSEDVRAQQRQAAEATRIAAILRARAERAGRPIPAVAPVPHQAG